MDHAVPDVSALSGTPVSRAPWTLRRSLFIVFLVSLVIRILMVGNIALIIHNDGIDYLNGAIPLYKGLSFSGVSCFRTPGYPIMLASAFYAFGMSSVGILLLQHGLGMLTALFVTGIAGKYVKPVWAMIPGILCAMDPQVFASASLLETEWAAMFLSCLGAVLVVRTNARPWVALLAGLVVGFACLVRPTVQVTVPFMLLAVAAHPFITWGKRAKLATVFALAVAAMCVPWVIRNHSRHVAGLSNGFGVALWTSLCQQDLLDRNYPLPPEEAELYAPVAKEHGGSDAMWAFVNPARSDPEYILYKASLTKRWALSSIKTNFPAYAARLPWSFCWQMNLYPDGGFIRESQMRWYFWMLSTDMDDHKRININFFFSGDIPDVYPLTMSGRDGPMRAFIGWWGLNYPGGLPQIPLCVLALTSGVLAVWKKDWVLVWLLLGSAAFVGVHVLMVFHQSRYSLPSTVMWYGVMLIPFALFFRSMRIERWPWPTKP